MSYDPPISYSSEDTRRQAVTPLECGPCHWLQLHKTTESNHFPLQQSHVFYREKTESYLHLSIIWSQ